MNVFHTHSRIVEDYATYIRSFLNISDPAILAVVEGELEKGKLWPEPLLQFNPAFEMAGSVADHSRAGTLHHDIADIFKGYSLYRHQVEAIKLGSDRRKTVSNTPYSAPVLVIPQSDQFVIGAGTARLLRRFHYHDSGYGLRYFEAHNCTEKTPKRRIDSGLRGVSPMQFLLLK